MKVVFSKSLEVDYLQERIRTENGVAISVGINSIGTHKVGGAGIDGYDARFSDGKGFYVGRLPIGNLLSLFRTKQDGVLSLTNGTKIEVSFV